MIAVSIRNRANIYIYYSLLTLFFPLTLLIIFEKFDVHFTQYTYRQIPKSQAIQSFETDREKIEFTFTSKLLEPLNKYLIGYVKFNYSTIISTNVERSKFKNLNLELSIKSEKISKFDDYSDRLNPKNDHNHHAGPGSFHYSNTKSFIELRNLKRDLQKKERYGYQGLTKFEIQNILSGRKFSKSFQKSPAYNQQRLKADAVLARHEAHRRRHQYLLEDHKIHFHLPNMDPNMKSDPFTEDLLAEDVKRNMLEVPIDSRNFDNYVESGSQENRDVKQLQPHSPSQETNQPSIIIKAGMKNCHENSCNPKFIFSVSEITSYIHILRIQPAFYRPIFDVECASFIWIFRNPALVEVEVYTRLIFVLMLAGCSYVLVKTGSRMAKGSQKYWFWR